MELLTKIVTIILVITSCKLCQCRYATSKLTITQPEYPSYNIIEPDGPGTYAFGYEIDDAASGNKQFRNEERLRNGTVQGSYGLVLPDGTISITKYVADENGYRATIENKNPRPTNANILDNHKRPSSTSAEIAPDLAASILSQQRPIKPIQPMKMEVNSQKQNYDLNVPSFFEPQHASPVIASYKPVNEANQVIDDRFHSHNSESKIQENAAFFQNSKLHEFFHSPQYIQDIYGTFITDSDNNDETTNIMSISDEKPLFGLASPLTKEAIWYKDHVNKNRLRNANNFFVSEKF